jgi:hypothetical protein
MEKNQQESEKSEIIDDEIRLALEEEGEFTVFDLGMHILGACFVIVCTCATALAVAGTIKFIYWLFS